MNTRDIKPGTCECCQFWRDKGWDDKGGIGKCDNPLVIEQVSMMKADLMHRFFVRYLADAKFIADSIRFENSFGCIHHKEIIGTIYDSPSLGDKEGI